jgi:hypothetical protein
MHWYWWLVSWVGASAVFGVFLGRWLYRVDQRRPSKDEEPVSAEPKQPHRKVG